MGLLARIMGMETREQPLLADPYFSDFMAMRSTGFATSEAVLSNLAVASRCVALRSELLASVPLFLFRRRPNGGRERADDNALYAVLHDIANPLQSAFEFRELMVRSLDLYGNFYARIETNGRGQVTALWPLLHYDVTVELLPSGRLRYRVYNGTRVETLLQDEVLHIRGASRDGIIGQSPIAIARGALSLALANSECAESLSRNALRPSGMLSYAQQLNESQKERIKSGMVNNYAGTFNAGRLLLMDGGAQYEKLSFSPEDAQFLETRKLGNEDVARIFGLPPTCVGITDKATYSNTEQEATALVRNSLGPLAGRIEAAMQRCLLTDAGRRTLYVEHELDGLLRGDVATRFTAYRIAREIGVYSANDIRQKENEPPIANGDGYDKPANWIPLGSPASGASKTIATGRDANGNLIATVT